MYVVAETDYRAIAYRYIRADATKQLAYHAVPFRAVAIWQRVVMLHPVGSTSLAVKKYRTMAVVYLASHALILLGHNVGRIMATAFTAYNTLQLSFILHCILETDTLHTKFTCCFHILHRVICKYALLFFQTEFPADTFINCH